MSLRALRSIAMTDLLLGFFRTGQFHSYRREFPRQEKMENQEEHRKGTFQNVRPGHETTPKKR